MEIGAVKQAFNEELIRLKKCLVQAKIQIIHKLTRKAKVVSQKTRPQNIQEKFNRKAKSAVDEVLIIKKIKVKDLAYFILTHKGELKEFLNKPQADSNKACARLLLHKVLQPKYTFMRTKFANMQVRDLLMSREERRKLKKEFKSKAKDDKAKSKKKTDVKPETDLDLEHHSENKSMESKSESDDCSDTELNKSSSEEMSKDLNSVDQPNKISMVKNHVSDKIQPNKKDLNNVNLDTSRRVSKIKQDSKNLKELKNKKTDANIKNKNLKEKLLSRNFKKEFAEPFVKESKIVDPFFVTSTGENYLSIAEPRPPDEIKDTHKHGNRKDRRAAMFGRVSKSRPKNFYSKQIKSQNTFQKTESYKTFGGHEDSKDHKDKRKNKDISEGEVKTVEKLHPSWEAKKKQSSLLPFEGKKIVFDD